MEVCQLQGTLMISLHVASSRQSTVKWARLKSTSVDGLSSSSSSSLQFAHSYGFSLLDIYL